MGQKDIDSFAAILPASFEQNSQKRYPHNSADCIEKLINLTVRLYKAGLFCCL